MRLCVDSKDLFTTLSTNKNFIDRPIRGDVGCNEFKFETGSVEKIFWVLGKVNLAEPFKKKTAN